MESEYRKRMEEIARNRNGAVKNEELFDLILSGFRDNTVVHDELFSSLNSHCVDPNAHVETRRSDITNTTKWFRDKLLAPVVVAVVLIVINLFTIR